MARMNSASIPRGGTGHSKDSSVAEMEGNVGQLLAFFDTANDQVVKRLLSDLLEYPIKNFANPARKIRAGAARVNNRRIRKCFDT